MQQIRGDAVLNVISRSGDTSFQSDFTATSGRRRPRPGQPAQRRRRRRRATAGRAAALVAAAEREATTWYARTPSVYTLGDDADYAGERDLVVGTGASSSAAEYNALEPDITEAIGDDQADFPSAVAAGSGALGPLEPVVIVAALLMALCCAWASAAAGGIPLSSCLAEPEAAQWTRNVQAPEETVNGDPAQLGGPLTGLAPGSRVAGYLLERAGRRGRDGGGVPRPRRGARPARWR